jgi:LmbE family N-acetylglucosaminyl deacetylase
VTELLSVVLPTYQRPERLRQAARSVLDQDYRSVELVVVDDGSGAATARTIDELTAGDRRVVVVRQDAPQGASAARNTGLAAARGELVAFCDDDDVWLPGAASAAVAALRPSIGVVYGWHQVLHESSGRCVTFRPPKSASPSLMRWINVPAILSGVVRRAVVGDALSFDTTLLTSEDWDLWLRCVDIAPMALVPTPLYRYVQHQGDRVTRLTGHAEGHRRFLEKHRSTMSSACIAHHELLLALDTRDRPAGREQMLRLRQHPANLGAVALLASEVLASELGRHRNDPGLPLRLAAGMLAARTGGSRRGGRARRNRRPGGVHRSRFPEASPAVDAGHGPAIQAISRPPVGAIWGWAQLATGRNASKRLIHGSALVLSPHPDDETIGCSLLIAKKVQRGYPVAVALATDGRAGWYSAMPRPSPDVIVDIRHHEWHRALDALVVPEDARFELGFPDGELSDHEIEMAGCIGELLGRLSPSQVFVTSPDDPHPDHRALARATRRAVDEHKSDGAGLRAGGDGTRSERRHGATPQVFIYRVYPGTGLWPQGHPPRATLAKTALQLCRRSVLDLVRARPLVLREPRSVSAKAAAVEAHQSQRQLLAGELRYVWRTGVELFRPMD